MKVFKTSFFNLKIIIYDTIKMLILLNFTVDLRTISMKIFVINKSFFLKIESFKNKFLQNLKNLNLDVEMYLKFA